jgi:hypothetical protein
MAQRSIEEAFHTIAPSRRRGVPNAPTVVSALTGSGGDLSTALSRAGTEIAQLRASYQQQVDLIKANTQALQSNTSGQGGHSAISSVGSALSGVFGGALGFLSPIISGITHLFGGGGSQPVTLPTYTAPPPVSIGGFLHSGGTTPGPAASANAPASQTQQASGTTTYSPQITVHVNAMDSQSFMDRSGDIANAVREAMLNNHPINGVVADL